MNADGNADGTCACPTCGRRVTWHDEAQRKYWPFCSGRCQMADLGKWLDGQYVISSPLGEDSLNDPDVRAQLDAAAGEAAPDEAP